jgi:hypothetical protein
LELSRALSPEEFAEVGRRTLFPSGDDLLITPDTLCQWRVLPPMAVVEGGEGTVEFNNAVWIIAWSWNEEFYEYREWLEFLVGRCLAPMGVTVSGTIRWQGEDDDDCGKIVAAGSKVRFVEGSKWILYDDGTKEQV